MSGRTGPVPSDRLFLTGAGGARSIRLDRMYDDFPTMGSCLEVVRLRQELMSILSYAVPVAG